MGGVGQCSGTPTRTTCPTSTAVHLQCVRHLDGPAIRNANRSDSRESIRRETPYFHNLREAKPGGFQTRVFPTFLGKVQIVSRTLSGLFLVGALNRPRKRKRTNRENPRTIPEQIGKIPEKSGKSQKGQKRTKKEGQVQIRKPPRLKPPPFSGP